MVKYYVVLFKNRNEAKEGFKQECKHIEDQAIGDIQYIKGKKIDPKDARDLDGWNTFQLRIYPENFLSRLDIAEKEVMDEGASSFRKVRSIDYEVLTPNQVGMYAIDEDKSNFFSKWVQRYGLSD